MDFFSFQSRTKFFINCNNFPKTTDTSDGFLRRCAFIRFPLKFVIGEDPKRPNERPGDKDLAKKLQTQEALTYIFNWILEGYKIITATGYFTKAEESDEIKEQYKEIPNPLVVFVKDRTPSINGDNFSADELYMEYVSWAETGHNKIMTRSNFRQKIQPIIEEYYTSVTAPQNAASTGEIHARNNAKEGHKNENCLPGLRQRTADNRHKIP